MEPLQLCFLWYVVFVFSVVLHEYAHAFVGYLYGDYTAAHHGLATLNPVPHIQRSPIGMIIVPLLSFIGAGWMIGWASTPYDSYWANANPKRAAMMSLAGPAANLTLVLIAGLLVHLGIAAGVFYPPVSIGFTHVVEANSDGLAQGMAVLVSILFTLNLVLLVFNLIPVPPLDGTAIGEFVFKGEMLYKYRQLMSHPNLRVFGIFIAWMVMGRIFGPIHTLALNALYIWRGLSYG
ncbi:MAG: site-2 protease family protein [Planctomycetota bacterium]|jgi:Zn-dependent protease